MQNLPDAVPLIVERSIDATEGFKHSGRSRFGANVRQTPDCHRNRGSVVRQQDRKTQQKQRYYIG